MPKCPSFKKKEIVRDASIKRFEFGMDLSSHNLKTECHLVQTPKHRRWVDRKDTRSRIEEIFQQIASTGTLHKNSCATADGTVLRALTTLVSLILPVASCQRISTSSTRRFSARPSGVSFGAAGLSGPTPTPASRSAAMPSLTRAWTMALARRSESWIL